MPSYFVFLDTNILFSRKPEQIISKSVVKILNECKEITPVDFFVASVVPSELAYQQSRTAIAASENMMKNQATISSAVGITLPDPPTREVCCEQAIHVVAEALAAADIQTYEIPIGSISWENLIEDACWRKSTFEEPPDQTAEWEKGFRDRLVLEASIEGLSERSSEGHLVFISGDNKLVEAFAQRSKSMGMTVSIFKDPSGLLSQIQLLDKSQSEKFVEYVSSSAPIHFYQIGNDNCIFNSLSLKHQIIEKFGDDAKQPNYLSLLNKQSQARRATAYAALGSHRAAPLQTDGLSNLIDSGTWKQASGLRIKIGATEFQPNEDYSTYSWISKVELACMLSSPSSISKMLQKTGYWIRIINVEVHWKCKIDGSGTITDSEVEGLEKSIVSPFIEADWQTRLKFGFSLFPYLLMPDEDRQKAMEDLVVGEEDLQAIDTQLEQTSNEQDSQFEE